MIKLIILLAVLCTCFAKFTLIPPQFSSNAVFQRNKDNVIYGLSDSPEGSPVSLVIPELGLSYTSSVNSKFFAIKIPARPASSRGVTFILTDATQTLNMTNILFGDVWVCSGQSNMVC